MGSYQLLLAHHKGLLLSRDKETIPELCARDKKIIFGLYDQIALRTELGN